MPAAASDLHSTASRRALAARPPDGRSTRTAPPPCCHPAHPVVVPQLAAQEGRGVGHVAHAVRDGADPHHPAVRQHWVGRGEGSAPAVRGGADPHRPAHEGPRQREDGERAETGRPARPGPWRRPVPCRRGAPGGRAGRQLPLQQAGEQIGAQVVDLRGRAWWGGDGGRAGGLASHWLSGSRHGAASCSAAASPPPASAALAQPQAPRERAWHSSGTPATV